MTTQPTSDELFVYHRLPEHIVDNAVRHQIGRLIDRHGSLRAAARVLKISPAYLSRLSSGQKQHPSDAMLRKLKLKRVVRYEVIP